LYFFLVLFSLVVCSDQDMSPLIRDFMSAINGLGMPHDQHFASGQEHAGGGQGLHHDPALFLVAKQIVARQADFLGFPDFAPQVADDRHLELLVLLRQGGKADASMTE
jgi:hypothetical protein